MANWYAVYTRPNQEKKVVDSLLKRRIENYCPHHKAVSTSGNLNSVVIKPLFTSYVFVRLNALGLDELRKINGVINLLYWLDKPVVIRDIEIEMIKRFLNEHEIVQLEKAFVNVKEIVKITNTNFENEEEGTKVGSDKVKLVLPSLGYSLVADVVVEKTKVLLTKGTTYYDPTIIKNKLNYGL